MCIRDRVTDPKKPLGQTIRILRGALGLTQEQLAEKAGLHWTFISRVEQGRRNISILKLHRICLLYTSYQEKGAFQQIMDRLRKVARGPDGFTPVLLSLIHI